MSHSPGDVDGAKGVQGIHLFYKLPFRLFILALYSTHAYQAPPIRVMVIPKVFVAVMVRLKRKTENRMVKTCLMFAEMA